jgi:hypothetical protein
MRLYEKVSILLFAIFVSILGFHLIASSSVCLLKTARAAGYEPIQKYSVRCDANVFHFDFVAQNSSQLIQSPICFQSSNLNEYVMEEKSNKSSKRVQHQ